MPNSIADKLKIKPGFKLLTLHAPDNFRTALKGAPADIQIADKISKPDQVHWFVMNRAQLEKEMSRVLKLVQPSVTVWVYYPKGSSKLQTDLTRDKGWDCLLAHDDKLAWINLISLNDTWSVFGFRGKTDADIKKDAAPKQQREIFNWVDPTTKTIKLPDDLAAAFKKNKKQAAFFDQLSFTNKKEYIEWIVTAKREETRMERLTGTIERLNKEWKNPRNT